MLTLSHIRSLSQAPWFLSCNNRQSTLKTWDILTTRDQIAMEQETRFCIPHRKSGPWNRGDRDTRNGGPLRPAFAWGSIRNPVGMGRWRGVITAFSPAIPLEPNNTPVPEVPDWVFVSQYSHAYSDFQNLWSLSPGGLGKKTQVSEITAIRFHCASD